MYSKYIAEKEHDQAWNLKGRPGLIGRSCKDFPRNI